MTESHASLPFFTHDTAVRKVPGAERRCNTCSPEESGKIIAFLTRKWAKELGWRFFNDLWDFTANRVAVRVADKWYEDSVRWLRFHGNENRRFAGTLIQWCLAWHLQIKKSERNPLGPL
jgi:nuclear transport factor 2 (NTF2) superfamily protein